MPIEKTEVRIYSADEKLFLEGREYKHGDISFNTLEENGRTSWYDFWFKWHKRPVQLHFQLSPKHQDQKEQITLDEIFAMRKKVLKNFASAEVDMNMLEEDYFSRKAVKEYIRFTWDENRNKKIHLVDTAFPNSKMHLFAGRNLDSMSSEKDLILAQILYDRMPRKGVSLHITQRGNYFASNWLQPALESMYLAYRISMPLYKDIKNFITQKKLDSFH